MTEKDFASKLKMYFEPQVVEKFAKLEQNEKNYQVAEVFDQIILRETQSINHSLRVAELGGGAHPDRYHRLFEKLLTPPRGHIDWVDVSGLMLAQAPYYLAETGLTQRQEVMTFIELDIQSYLTQLPDASLDVAIMKYTLEYLPSIDWVFELLAKKLDRGGCCVVNLTGLSPQLPSSSTNARFLYDQQEFPLDETRELKAGDKFTVRFYKESGNPSGGYLPGAEVIKHYYSEAQLRELAAQHQLEIYLGDWKQLLPSPHPYPNLAMDMMVLRKPE